MEIIIIGEAFLVDTILCHYNLEYVMLRKRKYKKGLSDV